MNYYILIYLLVILISLYLLLGNIIEIEYILFIGLTITLVFIILEYFNTTINDGPLNNGFLSNGPLNSGSLSMKNNNESSATNEKLLINDKVEEKEEFKDDKYVINYTALKEINNCDYKLIKNDYSYGCLLPGSGLIISPWNLGNWGNLGNWEILDNQSGGGKYLLSGENINIYYNDNVLQHINGENLLTFAPGPTNLTNLRIVNAHSRELINYGDYIYIKHDISHHVKHGGRLTAYHRSGSHSKFRISNPANIFDIGPVDLSMPVVFSTDNTLERDIFIVVGSDNFIHHNVNFKNASKFYIK